MQNITYHTKCYNSLMQQVFIFGASIVYGVGAKRASWADLIKQKIHSHMYGSTGVGGKFEIYNFAKPGITVDFVNTHLKQIHKMYSLDVDSLSILSVGLNDAKAIDSPTNYASTLEDYQIKMKDLLKNMQSQFSKTMCVGYTPVDESKTNPKYNPLSGNISYFSNKRIEKFNAVFQELCQFYHIPFIDFNSLDHQDWTHHHLSSDGVHPNQLGHTVIFDRVWPSVAKFIDIHKKVQ